MQSLAMEKEAMLTFEKPKKKGRKIRIKKRYTYTEYAGIA